MESDYSVQNALTLIYSAPLSPSEHKLLSCFVLDSANPNIAALYVIQRASADSETVKSNHLDLGLRDLLADWIGLLSHCRF